MSFARPELLWLVAVLPALVAAGVLGNAARRRRVLRLLGDRALIRRLGADGLDRPAYGRLALLTLGAFALGAAAAGPRWGLRAVEGGGRVRNIVLALDVSKSMLARDVAPSRLDRQKLLARRLLRELRGDRLGLVVFAGRAYILSPLTVDHGAVELYVDALDPEIVSYGGSSLAAALRQAVDLARGETAPGRDRAVVLVSDGEALEDESAVLAEAARAAQAGVVVHAVGIGTPAGAPVPDASSAISGIPAYKRDSDGKIVISRLDEDLLRRVAEQGGGRYVHVGQAGATDRLLAGLRSLDRTVVQGDRSYEPHDRSPWFIALALALLAADLGLAYRAAAPTPRSRFGAREALLRRSAETPEKEAL